MNQLGGGLGLQTNIIYTLFSIAGGYIALLLGNTNSDTMRLIRRWFSNIMMSYLRVIARQHMQGNAATMVFSG